MRNFNVIPWLLIGIIVVPVVLIVAMTLRAEKIEKDLTERAISNLAENHSWAGVEVDGRDLKLTGIAPTAEAREEAIKIADGIAFNQEEGTWGVRVIDASGIKELPVQSPYTVSASKTDGSLVLDGYVPSSNTRDWILEKSKTTFEGLSVTDNMELAGGADAQYSDRVGFMLDTLGQMSSGDVSLSDGTLNVAGVASDFAAYDLLNSTMAGDLPFGLGKGAVAVTPPAVSSFDVSATKTASGITLSGVIPHGADGQAILDYAQSVGVSADSLDLNQASGAPTEFGDRVRFALDQLNGLDTGDFELSNDKLSLNGVTGTLDVLDGTNQVFTELPFGLKAGDLSVRLPTASPYVFSASKGDGSLSISSNVPSTQVKSAITTAAQGLAGSSDLSLEFDPKSGAPEGFADKAAYVLGALALLATGDVSLKDNAFSLSGDVIDGDANQALNDYLSRLPGGLNITGNTVVTTAPPEPQPEPKPEDEIVDNDVNAETQSQEVADESEEGEGQSDGGTQSGEVAPEDDGSNNTDVADNSSNDSGSQNGADQTAPTESEIEEPELPTFSPYQVFVRKTEDGSFVAGNFPSPVDEMLFRQDVEAAAPGAQTSSIEIGQGEPDNFFDGIAAISEFLGKVSSGTGEISDKTISLKGVASDSDAYEAVLRQFANLPEGFEAGQLSVVAPVASPYIFNVKRDADGVKISGNSPDLETTDALKVDAERRFGANLKSKEVGLASGEPEGFKQVTLGALRAIGRLSEGTFTLSDKNVRLDGMLPFGAPIEEIR